MFEALLDNSLTCLVKSLIRILPLKLSSYDGQPQIFIHNQKREAVWKIQGLGKKNLYFTDLGFLYPQKRNLSAVFLVGQMVFPGRGINASEHQGGDFLIYI